MIATTTIVLESENRDVVPGAVVDNNQLTLSHSTTWPVKAQAVTAAQVAPSKRKKLSKENLDSIGLDAQAVF